MKIMWKLFHKGLISKAELEDILRANKDACDEMNTEDRERCIASREAMAGNDDFETSL